MYPARISATRRAINSPGREASLAGSDLVTIDKLTTRIESAVKAVPASCWHWLSDDRRSLRPPARFWRR